jgi:inhibitor of KinA sporulation pathway (predicted exonuclease)
MKFLQHSAAFVLGFLLIAGSAFAQGQQMQQQQSAQPDSITDEELEKFAMVTNELQKVQEESQKQVQAMLSDKEMDMQRFQQIMMSRQNPNMGDSVEVTEQEEKTMKEIQPKLQKMQQQSRKEMMGIMQENGLQPQRFQAISRALQSNPEVMKRFKKIAQDTSNNGN